MAVPLSLNVMSVTSANDKADNETIPMAVHRSRVLVIICLTAAEIPRKPQLGDSLMKAVRPVIGNSLMKAVRSVITSNGFPYFQIRSVGSHRMLEWEKKEK